jgi:hypothetical protein
MSIYQCHNMPRPIAGTPLQVQDGYYQHGNSTRMPRMVTVPFVMSTGCNYDATTTDPHCKGCSQVKEAA